MWPVEDLATLSGLRSISFKAIFPLRELFLSGDDLGIQEKLVGTLTRQNPSIELIELSGGVQWVRKDALGEWTRRASSAMDGYIAVDEVVRLDLVT